MVPPARLTNEIRADAGWLQSASVKSTSSLRGYVERPITLYFACKQNRKTVWQSVKPYDCL